MDLARKAKREPKLTASTHSGVHDPALANESLHPALQLQQEVGNQAVQELLRTVGVHPKLAISHPDDPEEHEADQIADRVMRAPDHAAEAPCPCMLSGGELCDECKKKQTMLQRRAAGPGPVPPIPNLIGKVVQSAGRPLDHITRSFFEPRLGRNLEHVRVHTDSSAAESARHINALAYAKGHHLVFGAGQYSPESSTGRRLLAHELAHVVQNEGASGAADDVRRQVPALAEPMPVEPMPYYEVEPANDNGIGPANDNAIGPMNVPLRGPRYMPNPADNSLNAMFARAAIANTREQAIYQGERPRATLQRGGTPPNFIEVTGHLEGAWSWGNATWRTRVFHVLDSLEYDVARANTEADLVRILTEYGIEIPVAVPGVMPTGSGRFWEVVYPDQFDPENLQLRAFMVAVRRRVAQVPALANTALARALALSYVGEDEVRSGPCNERDVPHAGGNTVHDDFATVVTGGNLNDYLIQTPEGWTCQTDGRDLRRPKVVWEVKTRHEWATDDRIGGSIYSPYIHGRILSMEAQRIKCSIAAARCGWQYKYAVDTPEVAQALNIMWGGTPPVFCFQHDGSPCHF